MNHNSSIIPCWKSLWSNAFQNSEGFFFFFGILGRELTYYAHHVRVPAGPRVALNEMRKGCFYGKSRTSSREARSIKLTHSLTPVEGRFRQQTNSGHPVLCSPINLLCDGFWDFRTTFKGLWQCRDEYLKTVTYLTSPLIIRQNGQRLGHLKSERDLDRTECELHLRKRITLCVSQCTTQPDHGHLT